MTHNPPLGASQRRRWRRAHDHEDYSWPLVYRRLPSCFNLPGSGIDSPGTL
jgi:hypothetical protein